MLRKRFLTLSILLILFGYFIHAQIPNRGILGVTVGGTYYLGDVNKVPLQNTNLSLGVLFKHPIDTRFSISGKLNYGNLSGDDSKSNNRFYTNRNVSFKNTYIELSSLAEFNFIPFIPGHDKYDYTPYVFAGLGLAYYFSDYSKYLFNIPFGVGFKYNLSESFIMGFDYSMHKTFTDKIDFYQIYNSDYPNKQNNYSGNNDWYSIFGIYFAYKINYRMKCPAFD